MDTKKNVLSLIPRDIIQGTDDQIIIGKIITSYSLNNEELLILLPITEKGDLKQLTKVPLNAIQLLASWNPSKLVTVKKSFSSKFSRIKRNQLETILKLDKENPTLLTQYKSPYENFFLNKNFYKNLIKSLNQKKRRKFFINIKNMFKALCNLFFGDLFIYTKKYSEISAIESDIKRKERALKSGLILSKNEESEKYKISEMKNEIEKLKEKQQESSRGFTVFLISVLTLCVYTQQCSISRKQTDFQERQTKIQERQLELENNQKIPKFNIYTTYLKDNINESIYITKANDAYFSSLFFEPSIICQLKTKDNTVIYKRITDYFNHVELPVEDRNFKYGLIGVDNIKKWRELKNNFDSDYDNIELLRFIKLSYKDFENKRQEQYFIVMPFTDALECGSAVGQHFFDKTIENVTIGELYDILKQSREKEDIVK